MMYKLKMCERELSMVGWTWIEVAGCLRSQRAIHAQTAV